ncbi:acyltransferase family protein [Microdochium nivale]|nr:acyltransferase family protein [Microdochium nivale]
MLDTQTPTLHEELDTEDSFLYSSDGEEEWGLLQGLSKRHQSLRRQKIQRAVAHVGTWLLALLFELMPSFLQGPFTRRTIRAPRPQQNTEDDKPPATITGPAKKLMSLDGIRGVACLIVFNFHFLYPYTKTVWHGFIPGGNLEFAHFHQLPLLCLFHRGRAAVCVFFAVSGYVLSYRFIQLVRARNFVKAHATLALLTFRRGMRLFLPPTFSLVVITLAAWLGAFEPGWRLLHSPWTAAGEWEPHPFQRVTLYDSLYELYRTWRGWSSPWNWNPWYMDYDPHLWTIPIEFRSSMVLFAALLGTAPLRALWRCLLLTWACMYCLSDARWDVAVFLGGAVAAESHLYLATLSESAGEDSITTQTHTSFHTFLFKLKSRTSFLWRSSTPYLVFALVLALFLLSFPDAAPEPTPGFGILAELFTPRTYGDGKYLFWHALGSILFIFAVPLLPRLAEWVFENAVAQYLGRISYALYLCHGPIMHSLGFAVQPWIWEHFAGVRAVPAEEEGGPVQWTGGVSGWCLGLTMGWLMSLVVTILLADVFWRYIDVGCVKIARAVENAMVAPLEVPGAGDAGSAELRELQLRRFPS